MKINRLFMLLAMTSLMFACEPEQVPNEDDKNPTEQPGDDPGEEPGDDPGDEPGEVLAGYKAVNFETVDANVISWDAADVIGIYPDDGAALPYV